jgi:4-carboxymuconolactone decarboxylase
MPNTDSTARIPPLEPPYSAEIDEALKRWMPPGSTLEPLALFRTLMVHDRLSGRMRAVGAGILGPSSLVEPRLREVVIHRTCALTGAHYEWGVHASAFARPLGFSDAQLRSTAYGKAEDSCWDEDQACVFRLAEELHQTSTISEELWQRLSAHFHDAEVLELMVTAGWYHVIAYICNGAGVQAEPWATPFPDRGEPGVIPPP